LTLLRLSTLPYLLFYFFYSVLKNEFLLREPEMALTLVEFILIIKDHLLTWQIGVPNREKKLYRLLARLFNEIDLNGNLLLDWDEFTNYIIEKASVLNNVKHQMDEIKKYTFRRLTLSKDIALPIWKLVYISDVNLIAYVEEKS